MKGSFFIIVRLWFNVMPGLPGFAASQLLAALGGAAIVFASIVALPAYTVVACEHQGRVTIQRIAR